MTTFSNSRTILLSAGLAYVLSAPLQAGLLTNTGFEAGLTGWTTVDQVGGEGAFLVQTGTLSPVTMTSVPSPPEGTSAGMSDAAGPGSHVLYQDFVVPMNVANLVLSFSLYINNGAPDFFTPPHLDFAGTDPDPLLRINQQARVDIVTTSADPFSVAPGDVLRNVFQTEPGDPLVSGYNNVLIDLTTLLRAHQGETLRLRFAEVDNVLTFNLGVDNVDISSIPEPSTLIMTIGALTCILMARSRRLSTVRVRRSIGVARSGG